MNRLLHRGWALAFAVAILAYLFNAPHAGTIVPALTLVGLWWSVWASSEEEF